MNFTDIECPHCGHPRDKYANVIAVLLRTEQESFYLQRLTPAISARPQHPKALSSFSSKRILGHPKQDHPVVLLHCPYCGHLDTFNIGHIRLKSSEDYLHICFDYDNDRSVERKLDEVNQDDLKLWGRWGLVFHEDESQG